MKKNFPRTLFRYVFEFIVAGLAGWIYEVATVWILFHRFVNRGILHLPIVPIYAVGAFLLLIILRKKINPIVLFIASMVITTVFELGASYLLEFIFHDQFWSYDSWYFNILGRSSLISSAIFGLLAVGYFYWLHPLSGKISRKLPESACLGLGIFATAAILTDLVISVAELLPKN